MVIERLSEDGLEKTEFWVCVRGKEIFVWHKKTYSRPTVKHSWIGMPVKRFPDTPQDVAQEAFNRTVQDLRVISKGVEVPVIKANWSHVKEDK